MEKINSVVDEESAASTNEVELHLPYKWLTCDLKDKVIAVFIPQKRLKSNILMNPSPFQTMISGNNGRAYRIAGETLHRGN